MPRVFVAGALLPTGGAYMAYHIGRLLHRHFGYEMVEASAADLGGIDINKVPQPIFPYDTALPSVGLFDLHKHMRGDDLLVAGPFFSQFLFGHRLPGRKIMYVQDFKTSSLIDGHYDLYVSVSSTVQRFLQAVYGIDSPVVPAFIEDAGPAPPPWHARPPNSVIVYMKSQDLAHQTMRTDLIRAGERMLPGVNLATVLGNRKLPHGDFLACIGSVRYLVNLSLAEGFGLVPLEAMRQGTMVVGLDGLAGADYLHSGENCLTTSLRRLDHFVAVIRQALGDEALTLRCIENARATAAQYGYDRFKSAWLRLLADFLKATPHG